MHPFTCPNRGDLAHNIKSIGARDHGMLIATKEGWRCPACDYRQDWAHGFMLRPLPEDDALRAAKRKRP